MDRIENDAKEDERRDADENEVFGAHTNKISASEQRFSMHASRKHATHCVSCSGYDCCLTTGLTLVGITVAAQWRNYTSLPQTTGRAFYSRRKSAQVDNALQNTSGKK